MRKYEIYKESDFVGIGKVPEHWEVKRLKHLGEAIIGLTYSPNDVTENEEGILVLRSSNIQDGFIAYDDCVYVDKEVNPNLITRKGDILICARNGSAHLVGKNICIDEKTTGQTFGAFMVVFRGKYWRYLSYFFNSPIFTSQTGMFSTTTINQLTSQTLNNLRIAYPSDIIEQENICNYLDDQTQKIDRLIANKKAQAEKLKELRQIEINNTVTKGLNPNAEIKDSGIEWLGEIPKHWEYKRLKDLANVVLGKMLQNDDSGSDELKPYLRSFNVQWEKVDLSDVKEMWLSEYEKSQYRLRDNDIVVSEGGEVGRAAIWKNQIEECYIQNSVHKISCGNKLNPNYLLYHFTLLGKAGVFDMIINKVSIGHLTREKLVTVRLLVPPFGEQNKIANYLEKRTTTIDQLIKNIEAQIEKLQELRKIKIYEAVTGKIKVRTTDLND